MASGCTAPPPSEGRFITVLSIDGGGIRGLIPATIIRAGAGRHRRTHRRLLLGRDCRDEHRRAHHRDAGGARREQAAALRRRGHHRVLPRDQRPQDLPTEKAWVPEAGGEHGEHAARAPVRRCVRIADTVTNVVVPAFDVKSLQPVIFSTYEALKNARLADVCTSTAAPPTFFPAHFFTTHDHDHDHDRGEREFHLVDGGVAANNPTMVAVSTVAREVLRRNPEFRPLEYVPRLPHRLRRHGVAQAGREVHAQRCAKWGVLGWLYDAAAGFTPLIDIFTHASADMVDIHVQVLLQVLGSNQHYLRIQDDSLEGHASSVDVATRENMEALIGIGRDLLQKPVARVNIDTGVYEPVRRPVAACGDGDCGSEGRTPTNDEALRLFATDQLRLRKRNFNYWLRGGQ